MNPVVLLDEVDKLGADFRGDPAAALLEVLDPAQNHTFRDHYLDLDLDLSDVLFLATANVVEQIPQALLDRMEVVTLDGYTADDKAAIARDFLWPRQLERAALDADEVTLTDDALTEIVAAQGRDWPFIVPQFLGFAGFLIAAAGEPERPLAGSGAQHESGGHSPSPD